MANFCSNCGVEINSSAFCPSCGMSTLSSSTSPASPGNGLAITALVLAIFPYTSWIGLILGYVARAKNKSSKQAKAAIIVGWVIFAIEVIGGAVLGAIAVSGGFSSSY